MNLKEAKSFAAERGIDVSKLFVGEADWPAERAHIHGHPTMDTVKTYVVNGTVIVRWRESYGGHATWRVETPFKTYKVGHVGEAVEAAVKYCLGVPIE